MKIFVILSITFSLLLSFCLQAVRGEDKYIIFLSSEATYGNVGLLEMDNDICGKDQPESVAIVNRGEGILENFKPDASYWNTQGELLFETNEEVTFDQVEEVGGTIYYHNGDTPTGEVRVWTGRTIFCGSESGGNLGTPWTAPGKGYWGEASTVA
jgi:hypothetical protein